MPPKFDAPQSASHQRIPLNQLIHNGLNAGLASSLAIWSVWFLTHLPWVAIQEKISIPLILVCWLCALAWFLRDGSSRANIHQGVLAGLLSALIGLLILGSKLTQQSAADHASLSGSTTRPNAVLIALGFLALGAVLGAIASIIAPRLPAPRAQRTPLSRFAWICVAVSAPLIVIGGLVTSANAGMAVPDWPNTFGSNMFLYPLGPRAQALDPAESRKVFLEHSHRLFGTLLGLSVLIMMVWVLLSNVPRGVKALAVIIFLAVCAQGILGGYRVRMGNLDPQRDMRILAVLHGVSAQIVLGMLVALALRLTEAFQRSMPTPVPGGRARIFAAAAMHSTLVQLIFGALFRHFRHSDHTLWSHAGFAVVVLAVAVFGALMSMRLVKDSREQVHDQPALALLQRCAALMLFVVIIQFALGWAAFLFGAPRLYDPQNVGQAVIRTLHQANGAALVALTVANWMLARRLAPKLPAR